MFSKRRHSRPVSTASYTGVSSQSNSPAPASGALAAASVIGKALKDNNHQAKGLKLPQQPQKNSQIHRNSSLLGTRRNSNLNGSNSITSTTFRPPSTVRGGSRSVSLITNGSSPMTSNSPNHVRTRSFNSQPRQQTSQRRVSSDNTYSQFSAPPQRISTSRTSSIGSSSSRQRPPSQQHTPSTPKMIKKWIPSANGLVCVEVPATPQLGTPAQRAIARSSSMNSLSNKSRNQALKRAASFTGNKQQQQQQQHKQQQQHQQHQHQQQNQQQQKSSNSNDLDDSPFKQPTRGFHTPVGTPTKQSLKQKASLQSMHTQGQYSMSFEPTILEDEEIKEEDESEPIDVSQSDLENLKDGYLVELEHERLQEEEIERQRARNEKLETIERERAFSLASNDLNGNISIEKITVLAEEIGNVKEESLDKEINGTSPIEDESYTDTERLLAEQRLEELVKQKEQEILAEIQKQKQLEAESGPVKIDSSVISVVSSEYGDSVGDRSDDTDTLDEEATAHSVEDSMVNASNNGVQKQEFSTQTIVADSQEASDQRSNSIFNSTAESTGNTKISDLKGTMESESQSQFSVVSSLIDGYHETYNRQSQEPEESISVMPDPITPIKSLDTTTLEETPSRVTMAKQLRATLGVSKTPEIDDNKPVFSSISTPSVVASDKVDITDLAIPKRSARRPGSVNNSISSIPSDVMRDLKVTAAQVQSGGSSIKSLNLPSQTNTQLSPKLRPPKPNGDNLLGRRKSVLKNSNSSSSVSLANNNKTSAAYLSLTTAENTRLNAMASSSSVNLCQVPSAPKQQVNSPRRSAPVNRNGRQQQQQQQQQQQRSMPPTLRDSQVSTINKRQQRLSGVPQQPLQTPNHQLAAAAKAARQHQRPISQQQQQQQQQQHNIQQRRVNKQPVKRASMYEVQQRQHPRQQEQRPMSTYADPKLRAAELYKKANSKDGFYKNPYPEHLTNMKKSSSFEKLPLVDQQQTNGNATGNSNVNVANIAAKPKRSNRLTLRDSVIVEQGMNGTSTPMNGGTHGGGIFKSRFNDSDSDLDVPVFNNVPSNGNGNGNIRSSSVQVHAPKSASNNGARFFSEQPNSSKTNDVDAVETGDKKKKKFGKLRRLFGSSKKS